MKSNKNDIIIHSCGCGDYGNGLIGRVAYIVSILYVCKYTIMYIDNDNKKSNPIYNKIYYIIFVLLQCNIKQIFDLHPM